MPRIQHVKNSIALQEANRKIADQSQEILQLKAKLSDMQNHLSLDPSSDYDEVAEKIEPLNRSSMEAYGGMALGLLLGLLPMTWWLRIISFVILCGLVADFGWRSPFTYKWKRPLKILIVLVCVCWLAYTAYKNVASAYATEMTPGEGKFMTAWGRFGGYPVAFNLNYQPPKLFGDPANTIDVDGRLLTRFADNFNLVAVCLITDGKENYLDVGDISKSAAFDITPETIHILIPWSASYYDHMRRDETGTNYALLLVPKSVNVGSFSTIHKAMSQGAKVIDHHSGPP